MDPNFRHQRWWTTLLLFLLLVGTTDGFSVFTGSPSKQTAKAVVTVAQLPQDLAQIQKCRKTAFQNDKPVSQLMDSQQRFVNATTAAEGRATCLVARGRNNVILGTADISKPKGDQQRQVTITNVFVTPEARGQGLAKLLLQAIEDEAIAQGATSSVEQSLGAKYLQTDARGHRRAFRNTLREGIWYSTMTVGMWCGVEQFASTPTRQTFPMSLTNTHPSHFSQKESEEIGSGSSNWHPLVIHHNHFHVYIW
eukprot:scaffold2782_cov182-Amphora_coffeaeformis.AAC.30